MLIVFMFGSEKKKELENLAKNEKKFQYKPFARRNSAAAAWHSTRAKRAFSALS